MPLTIPQQTLTSSNYVAFGGTGYYSSGYIQVGNGSVDVLLSQTQSSGTRSVGVSSDILSPGLTAGQYTFSKGEGTFITGLKVRPANGALSNPSQSIQGILYEPTSTYIIPIASTNVTNQINSMQLIAKQVLSSAAGSITFSGIPQTFNCLFLVAVVQSDQATDQAVFARFDGDAGAHYFYQLSYGVNSTPTASFTSAGTFMQLGLAAASAGGTFGTFRTLMPFYTSASAFTQPTQTEFGIIGSTNPLSGTIAGTWTGSGAAITFMQVFPNAGNFTTGSTMILYGL